MTKEALITIVLPAISGTEDENAISDSLRTLTEAVCVLKGETPTFGLGGSFGYGSTFENNTFTMNPYYWGDCDCGFDEKDWEWSLTHHHSEDCYQSELKRRKQAAGWTEVKNLPFLLNRPEGMPIDESLKIENKIYQDLMAKFDKPRHGCAVHCTCGHKESYVAWREENDHSPTCSLELPNFLHKPSGLRVDWYKYIGRDMKISAPDDLDLKATFEECLASLKGGQAS